MLDLWEPELLTVALLCTDGRRSSWGNPMASSLPLPGRNPGESWTSSVESLKKLLPNTLDGITDPFVVPDQGVAGEVAVAVGGFRDIDGTRPPDVSKTASCFR